MSSRLLRDYQAQAIQEIYAVWAKGLRPLLVMPTGSGKSFTIFTLIEQCYKVYPVLLVVRTINLVEQLIADAKKFNLPYGVVMSGHPEYDPQAPIQICSIDTLRSRNFYPFLYNEKVILAIDEADESKAKGFQDFIAAYNTPLVVGMTATPYNGLNHFDIALTPITAEDLRKRGILVDYRYIVPEEKIDVSDIEVEGGEYKAAQVTVATNKRKLYGDAVKAWLEYGDHRPTLLFCSNVMQSKETVAAFRENKIFAAHIDATTPKDVRRFTIKKFQQGNIKILSVVGLLKRGTDIPEIGCIIDAAPTLRINNHIQKLGRGSRENEHFKDCIVIDMAANCETLNHFYAERKIDLTSPVRLSASQIGQAMITCKKCFRPAEPKEFINGICPYCGYMNKEVRKLQQEKAAKLKLLDPELIDQKVIINDFKKTYWKYCNISVHTKKFYQYKKGYRRDEKIREHVHFLMLDKYGALRVAKVAKAIFLGPGVITKWAEK